MKPRHPEELKLMLILLFLVNQEDGPTGYAMVRTMARRYGFNDFNGYLKNCVNQEFVSYFKEGESESYQITADGTDYFTVNLRNLKDELDENYPLAKDITALLIN